MVKHAELIAESRAVLLDMLDAFVEEHGCHDAVWRSALKQAGGESYDQLVAGLTDGNMPSQPWRPPVKDGEEGNHADAEQLLDDFARRMSEYCATELTKLCEWFATLIGCNRVTVNQLPVGAQTVCRALWATSQLPGFSYQEWRILMVHACISLPDRLLYFYWQLNQKAVSAEPSVTLPEDLKPAVPVSVIQQDRIHNETAAAEVPQPGSAVLPQAEADRALNALRKAVMQRHAVAQSGSAGRKLRPEVIERIERWLLDARLKDDNVIVALSSSSFASTLPEQMLVMSDVIERIFRQIMTCADVPEKVRRAIIRLQMPMLRLVLHGEQLSTDMQHPAYRLVDVMARLGRSLPSYLSEHSVCVKLNVLSQRMVHKSGTIREDFSEVLTAVESAVEKRHEITTRLAADVLGLANSAERREVAQQLTSHALDMLMVNDMPDVIRYFLKVHWFRVLARTLYKHGEKHPVWREQLDVAHQLVLSSQPGEDGKMPQEQRTQLPQLISRISTGLSEIGMNQKACEQALAGCMALHAALIMGRMPPIIQNKPVSPLLLYNAREKADLRMLQHGMYSPQYIDEVAMPRLGSGTWLELMLPGELHFNFNGCIAWVGSLNKAVLIVDPDTGQMLVATLRAIHELLQQQCCLVKSQRSLVEEAAEKALYSM